MNYQPERGDLVWLNFNPQAGHRPALILSPGKYNQRSGMALVCPITSQNKQRPYHVLIQDNGKINGFVISDHVCSIDWRARNAKFISKANPEVINEVVDKIATLLPLE
ncbi:type II toxin-antitoxin system PemK/MazF family toxin [Candidatus Venteria ishoeyi]|uniref:mRNA interferase MazF n=1 Tax=Candidatus Venteria ishoeyi TaxID=1899563 RepID=A0A1H6FA45_9GAMM|nr:type II toxin-antitoxin system PemK/MazF family toxin [Candidatus Venteria ishoeyi]MDM8546740.1 type II toxin-antitoxin system PemK/MazF family toxin [Candidatus Venteria ishoeyi]SEH06967.1 mRNA interferase MazF [Candidatus Venteria ishoeyi]